MADLIAAIKFHSTLADGSDNAFGFVYTYVAGTLTPLATYTDQGGLTANANPVALDVTGRASIWLLPGRSYKFVSVDAALATVPDGTVDNISAAITGAELGDSTSLANGDALVAVKAPLTGSVATTQHEVNSREFNDFDAMTAAQMADVRARSAAVDVTAAVQAAFDYQVAGTVGSFEVNLPDGMRSVTKTGDRVLQVQNGLAVLGSSLEGTGIKVAAGSTATAIVEDNGNAAKIEFNNFTIYGNNNTSATTGFRLGMRDGLLPPGNNRFGTYGTLDNLMVRDLPNAIAYEVKPNVIACGKLYSMGTKDGLIMNAAGSAMRVEAFTPLGITGIGLQLCDGSSVGFYEFEGPDSDDAIGIIFDRGGSVENFVFSIGAGRNIKTPVQINDTYVTDYYLGPTTKFYSGGVSPQWGDPAAATTGTMTAVGTNNFTDTSKNFRVDQLKGGVLILTSGAYSGDRYEIAETGDKTVTVKGTVWTPGRVPIIGTTYTLDYFIKIASGGGYAHCESGSQYQYVGHNLSITNEARINALTVGIQATPGTAPTLSIASNVIAPTRPISKVGAGLIKTITVPSLFALTGGSIKIRPTAAFTWDATGNIAIAGTAVIGRTLEFDYDAADATWTPSYV